MKNRALIGLRVQDGNEEKKGRICRQADTIRDTANKGRYSQELAKFS